MRIRILPYKQLSRSAAALARELNGKVLRLENSRHVPRRGDVIINWGNLRTGIDCERMFNWDVRVASNKLLFFQAMVETGLCPRFWTDPDSIPDDAYPIVCRTVLAGHSGEGIVIADTPEEIVPAPLYVEYIKKSKEFRIHVGRESIISQQRKVARQGVDPEEWRIRNLANGFVFQREGISVPDCVIDAAKRTLETLQGIDFGAVDIIYNDRRQRSYVLEVNTAPGLEGTTITEYGNFFRSLI